VNIIGSQRRIDW